MALRRSRNARIRSTLIVIILATLPCYCLGLIAVGGATVAADRHAHGFEHVNQYAHGCRPDGNGTPLIFPSATATNTPTITWTPSQTFTQFVPPSRTPSYTPTNTLTNTPIPSSTPTETTEPSDTPAATRTPTSTPTEE